MPIALDATYSLGKNLSGVGVYSREILFGLASAHPEEKFRFYYRPHRFLRSFSDPLPTNASRRLLRGEPHAEIFHALNQRVDDRASKTISTFHDLFVMTGDYSSAEFRARFTEQAREAAERSDLIIAVSQFTASQVEQLLHVEPSRIRVVYHGVRIPEEPRVSREKFVLNVGAIQRRKNIARLVKAFERMPDDWKLVLAGAANGFGAVEELRAVEGSPRRASIEVLGYVTPDHLTSLYNRASIFAFPSLDEGFGMPVLDAFANRIPVITSNCSAMPEVAGAAAILVNPSSTDEIGDALIKLATDEEQRNILIERGIERASHFSWDQAVTATWSVYDELR